MHLPSNPYPSRTERAATDQYRLSNGGDAHTERERTNDYGITFANKTHGGKDDARQVMGKVTRQLPTTLDLRPEEPIRVASAIIKLKEYIWCYSDNEEVQMNTRQSLCENIKNDKSRMDYGIPISDIESKGDFVKPCPAAGQSWREVIVVKIPDTWNINPNTRCRSLIIPHNFQVVLTIKVGNHPAKDLRIESKFVPITLFAECSVCFSRYGYEIDMFRQFAAVPMVLAAPRPPRESIPSFDINQYMLQLVTQGRWPQLKTEPIMEFSRKMVMWCMNRLNSALRRMDVNSARV